MRSLRAPVAAPHKLRPTLARTLPPSPNAQHPHVLPNSSPACSVRLPLQVPRLGGGSPPTYCLKYTVWCRGNTRELYDLSTDPYEQYNVADVAPQALINRLDAVMSVLVHCSGADCVHPHGVLHPKGNVLTFAQVGAGGVQGGRRSAVGNRWWRGAGWPRQGEVWARWLAACTCL